MKKSEDKKNNNILNSSQHDKYIESLKIKYETINSADAEEKNSKIAENINNVTTTSTKKSIK